jgi:hypothetical protein
LLQKVWIISARESFDFFFAGDKSVTIVAPIILEGSVLALAADTTYFVFAFFATTATFGPAVSFIFTAAAAATFASATSSFCNSAFCFAAATSSFYNSAFCVANASSDSFSWAIAFAIFSSIVRVPT